MEYPLTEFLDIDLLNRLPTLELRARFIVDGFLTGLHRSPLKGSSAEFMGYRDYQQQDDPKLIDWKVYARSDRLHVRLREDDTNMRVYLLLDQSASMNYRSGDRLLTKWDYARSLAAALLLFIHRQRDSAALGFAGDGLTDFVRGEGSRLSHLQAMTAMLYRDADANQSRLDDAMTELAGKVERRSIVIVISDFYEEIDHLQESLKRFSHDCCEVILFRVLDPRELDFDFKRGGIFVDRESQAELPVNPELIRHKYAHAVATHTEQLRQSIGRLSGDLLVLPTSTPPLEALGLYLAQRKGF